MHAPQGVPSGLVLIGRGLAPHTPNNTKGPVTQPHPQTHQKLCSRPLCISQRPHPTTPTPGGGRATTPTTMCVGWFGVPVDTAEGKRPVPSRTRKLSPPAPMVLRPPGRGRVGHRRNTQPPHTPPPTASRQPAVQLFALGRNCCPRPGPAEGTWPFGVPGTPSARALSGCPGLRRRRARRSTRASARTQ